MEVADPMIKPLLTQKEGMRSDRGGVRVELLTAALMVVVMG